MPISVKWNSNNGFGSLTLKVIEGGKDVPATRNVSIATPVAPTSINASNFNCTSGDFYATFPAGTCPQEVTWLLNGQGIGIGNPLRINGNFSNNFIIKAQTSNSTFITQSYSAVKLTTIYGPTVVNASNTTVHTYTTDFSGNENNITWSSIGGELYNQAGIQQNYKFPYPRAYANVQASACGQTVTVEVQINSESGLVQSNTNTSILPSNFVEKKSAREIGFVEEQDNMTVIQQIQNYDNTIKFNIKDKTADEYQITISDIQGRIIKSFKTRGGDITVEKNDMENGIYVMKVDSRKHHETFKFSVVK
jgi:hypothetical protein